MLDTQPSAAPSMAEGKILLVDDDRDLLSSLRDLLEPEGYEVATASDPDGARRIAAEFRPDIALLDVKLGTANGIDLIPILKERLPGISCVVMTAFAATENAVQAMRNGADDYLNKPIDPANLMHALNRCRQHQRLEREKQAVVAALRDSEERIRAIMENVADALVTIDDGGSSNRSTRPLSGCSVSSHGRSSARTYRSSFPARSATCTIPSSKITCAAARARSSARGRAR